MFQQKMSNLTIKFYPYDKTSKGKEVPIYCRLTKDRKKAEFYTELDVEISKWNNQAQEHIKSGHQLNEDLAEIKANIIKIKKKLEYEDKPVSAKILKKAYQGGDSLQIFVIAYFDEHLAQMKKAGEHSVESIAIYRQTRNKVFRFIEEKKKERDYLIRYVDFKFIKELDYFLITMSKHRGNGETLDRNTVNKHHSRFRTVLIRAWNEGLIGRKPYANFKLRNIKKQQIVLEDDELLKLMTHDLGGYPGLIRARDIFIFSAFTSIQYRAAQALNANRVKYDDNGYPYLEFDPGKSQLGEVKIERIPLLKPAYEIYAKYKEGEGKITGKILPRMANGTINKHLKVIAELVGIDKRLHHHVSRHTCATTVLFGNDVDIKDVSNWLTHSRVSMTEVYTHNNLKKLMKIGQVVDEKLANEK